MLLPQGLSNTAWGLATLRHTVRCAAWRAEMLRAAHARMHEFSNQV